MHSNTMAYSSNDSCGVGSSRSAVAWAERGGHLTPQLQGLGLAGGVMPLRALSIIM